MSHGNFYLEFLYFFNNAILQKKLIAKTLIIFLQKFD